MKIAFFSTMEVAPWGGSEDLWSEAARRLLVQGHEVVASVKDWGSAEAPAIRELERAGAKILRRRLPSPPALGSRIGRRIKRALGAIELPQPPVADLIAERPELTLISAGGLPHLKLCAGLVAARSPFAILFQAAAEYWWPADEARREALIALQAARAAFFVSERNRQLIGRQAVYEHPAATVVRNPFRVPYDLVPTWPASSSPWRIAFVGRLDPAAKGCDLLLEVLTRKNWRKRDVLVSFFGSGSAAEGMRALAEFHQLHNVRFEGRVSDVAAIWRENHALVLPSRFEGLPLAVVEAMLCGRPCIVTDVGGNTELIRDNVTGFVAAAPTVDLLAAAMERAWEARASWAAMGQRAAISVREQVPADPAAAFAQLLLQCA